MTYVDYTDKWIYGFIHIKIYAVCNRLAKAVCNRLAKAVCNRLAKAVCNRLAKAIKQSQSRMAYIFSRDDSPLISLAVQGKHIIASLAEPPTGDQQHDRVSK